MKQPQLTSIANLTCRGHAGHRRRSPTEQVPLLEDGGIEAFLKREGLPHAADARYVPNTMKPGYEISFTGYFFAPHSLRSREEIQADLLPLERETDGPLGEITGGKA